MNIAHKAVAWVSIFSTLFMGCYNSELIRSTVGSYKKDAELVRAKIQSDLILDKHGIPTFPCEKNDQRTPPCIIGIIKS